MKSNSRYLNIFIILFLCFLFALSPEPSFAQKSSLSQPVSSFKAVPYAENVVLLSWDRHAGADRYLLYVKRPGEEKFQYLYLASSTHYLDQNASAINNEYKIYPSGLEEGVRCFGPPSPVVSAKGEAVNGLDGVRGFRARNFGNGKIILDWSASPQAHEYMLYVKRGDGQSHFLALTKDIFYLDSAAPEDVYSFYWIYPVRTEGTKRIYGRRSPYVYAKGYSPSGLDAVKNLKASSTTAGVRLRWDGTEGADKYIIYVKRGNAEREYLSLTASDTFLDAEAGFGDISFYWVFPAKDEKDGLVAGPSSNYVYGRRVLSLPQDVQTFPRGSQGILFEWKVASNADGVVVYGKNTAGQWDYLIHSADNTWLQSDAPLRSDGYYRFYSYKIENDRRVESTQYVELQANRLSAVSGLKAKSDWGSIRIDWDPIPGVDGYYIYRGDGSTMSRLTQTQDNFYIDSDVPKGENRFYRVRAFFRDPDGGEILGPTETYVYAYAKENLPEGRFPETADPLSLRLVNKKNPVSPLDYYPEDLVYVGNEEYLRSEAARSFEAMQKAASREGMPISPVSGFRSYDTQASVYANYVRNYGASSADISSAKAGYSEHQTGLAIDICASNNSLTGFDEQPQYTWMLNNAHLYGWILRYPDGYTHITGYKFEPWHWRYIGTKDAIRMKMDRIPTFEQYLGAPAARYY